jgi:endonuclease G
MKTKNLFFLFACALAFTACGGDDDPVVIKKPDVPNIDDGTSANTNKNTTGPLEAQTRYEFPKLKGGNNVVIVHKATLNDAIGEFGVNYCVEWNPDIHAQRWSCYILYDKINYKAGSNVSRYYVENGGNLLPTSQYPNDADMNSTYLFSVDPYRGSGYDHGHICPSADRQRAVEANYQTFFMTNMQPQRNVFNAGLWSKMEEKVRAWGNLCDTLYICKGGTIDSQNNILGYIGSGANKIPVPKYFFMALFSKKGTTLKALGFWVEHRNEDHKDDNLKNYAVSIDELEEKTGIDFFCNLPDNTENTVEATLNLSDWNLK